MSVTGSSRMLGRWWCVSKVLAERGWPRLAHAQVSQRPRKRHHETELLSILYIFPMKETRNRIAFTDLIFRLQNMPDSNMCFVILLQLICYTFIIQHNVVQNIEYFM